MHQQPTVLNRIPPSEWQLWFNTLSILARILGWKDGRMSVMSAERRDSFSLHSWNFIYKRRARPQNQSTTLLLFCKVWTKSYLRSWQFFPSTHPAHPKLLFSAVEHGLDFCWLGTQHDQNKTLELSKESKPKTVNSNNVQSGKVRRVRYLRRRLVRFKKALSWTQEIAVHFCPKALAIFSLIGKLIIREIPTNLKASEFGTLGLVSYLKEDAQVKLLCVFHRCKSVLNSTCENESFHFTLSLTICHNFLSILLFDAFRRLNDCENDKHDTQAFHGQSVCINFEIVFRHPECPNGLCWKVGALDAVCLCGWKGTMQQLTLVYTRLTKVTFLFLYRWAFVWPSWASNQWVHTRASALTGTWVVGPESWVHLLLAEQHTQVSSRSLSTWFFKIQAPWHVEHTRPYFSGHDPGSQPSGSWGLCPHHLGWLVRSGGIGRDSLSGDAVISSLLNKPCAAEREMTLAWRRAISSAASALRCQFVFDGNYFSHIQC